MSGGGREIGGGAPLPQTPSPEEWLAFCLVCFAQLVPPERGRVSISLGKSTAADRAAADVQHNEKRRCGGGRFSKRSASPGPPPEEWLGFELSLSANNMPLLVGGRRSVRVLWSQQLAEPPQTYSVWRITNFYYK